MNKDIAVIAISVLQMADAATTQALIETVLQRLGIQDIEGVPIPQWISAKRAEQIEKSLLSMGDMNPGLHDAVRAEIDEAISKTKRG